MATWWCPSGENFRIRRRWHSWGVSGVRGASGPAGSLPPGPGSCLQRGPSACRRRGCSSAISVRRLLENGSCAGGSCCWRGRGRCCRHRAADRAEDAQAEGSGPAPGQHRQPADLQASSASATSACRSQRCGLWTMAGRGGGCWLHLLLAGPQKWQRWPPPWRWQRGGRRQRRCRCR